MPNLAREIGRVHIGCRCQIWRENLGVFILNTNAKSGARIWACSYWMQMPNLARESWRVHIEYRCQIWRKNLGVFILMRSMLCSSMWLATAASAKAAWDSESVLIALKIKCGSRIWMCSCNRLNPNLMQVRPDLSKPAAETLSMEETHKINFDKFF